MHATALKNNEEHLGSLRHKQKVFNRPQAKSLAIKSVTPEEKKKSSIYPINMFKRKNVTLVSSISFNIPIWIKNRIFSSYQAKLKRKVEKQIIKKSSELS